jgi:phosphosulfolactate synthase (CoM biosynthesis protein A)
MRQYYVLNLDPRAGQVFEFIREHKLACEVHLNRTRFWVPDGTVLTEFVLRYGDSCAYVDESLDLTTGHPKL